MEARDTGAPDFSHSPFVRRLPSRWVRDPEGQWRARGEDPTRWEVVCPQCGDDGGPAERQGDGVRRLRGPYGRRGKAQRVADRHFRRNAGPGPDLGPASDLPVF